jgi:hypothetical protein
MGVVMLVSYLDSNCDKSTFHSNSGVLIFIFGIIGNFALACMAIVTLPIIMNWKCSVLYLVLMYLFGVAAITGNLGEIITFSIKGDKHMGICYVRKHLQGLMIGLAGIELGVVIGLMYYIPIVKFKFRGNQRAQHGSQQ